MKSKQPNRESQRVRQLAAEYTKKGYTVVHPRAIGDLPFFLRNANYIPDLIVTSERENLVIEVKTSKSLKEDKAISRVSDLVNRQPGWQFLFVLTRSKTDESISPAPITARWHDLLRKSRDSALAKPEFVEAAFVLGWAALEGLLREATSGDKLLKQTASGLVKAPMSLVRDAAILGLIDRKDVPKLDAMFHMRNQVVHSITSTRPTLQDLSELHRLVDDIIRNYRSTDEVS
jgi:hypothetical protein